MINPAIYIVGPGIQAEKGTAAAGPTITHGLVSGSPFAPSISNEDIKETHTSRMTTVGSYRSEIGYAGSLGILGHEDILGAWLYLACGAVATTGEGPTFTHLFTPGGSLPYFSLFSKIDGEAIAMTQDTKVGAFELAWEGVKPLDIKVDTVAGKGKFIDGAWTGPDQVGRDRFFTCADCTILLSPNSDTPVALTGTPMSGSVKIENNVEAAFGAGSAEALDVQEGMALASGSMTIRPADDDLLRSILTGSATGTDISSVQVEGSFKWTFLHNKDSALSLEITATGVPFSISAIDADPEGGNAEVDVEFSKANTITVRLVNTTASHIA